MLSIEKIALVNEADEITGYAGKMEVHRKAMLHRAFSIQIIHPEKGFLLQKRSSNKYHSPSLWSNTCCSHLPKGIEMNTAIHRRLIEEMGFDCELNYIGKFSYTARFENELVENEIDHVYLGIWDGIPEPNSDEVETYTWVFPDMLKSNLAAYPQLYTLWLPYVFSTIRNAASTDDLWQNNK